MNTIGERVTYHREKLGLSKIQLARVVGIGEGMISHIENNRRKPSLKLAIRLAKHFEISMDELLGERERQVA